MVNGKEKELKNLINGSIMEKIENENKYWRKCPHYKNIWMDMERYSLKDSGKPVFCPLLKTEFCIKIEFCSSCPLFTGCLPRYMPSPLEDTVENVNLCNNKKSVRYIILSSDNHNDLEEKVEECLNDGYELYGELIYSEGWNSDRSRHWENYMQIVVKKEKEETEKGKIQYNKDMECEYCRGLGFKVKDSDRPQSICGEDKIKKLKNSEVDQCFEHGIFDLEYINKKCKTEDVRVYVSNDRLAPIEKWTKAYLKEIIFDGNLSFVCFISGLARWTNKYKNTIEFKYAKLAE